MTRRFDPAALLEAARAQLAVPPALEFIERHAGVGELVASFVLPLDLCPTTNAYGSMPRWRLAKIKNDALVVMRRQMLANGGMPRSPLAGRPSVRAVRFSAVAPDAESGWCKIPIDRLLVTRVGRRGNRRVGLGLLADDRPALLDVRAWWEPAQRGQGFVLVEVWSGD